MWFYSFIHIYVLLNQDAIVGVFEHIWSKDRIWVLNDELIMHLMDLIEKYKYDITDCILQSFFFENKGFYSTY